MRRGLWPTARIAVAVGIATLLATAASGAISAQPKPGALYKGSEPHCTTTPPGATCTFVFRVSTNGRSMKFAGTQNVVGAWACNGGGGEAVLGPFKKPLQGQPVPLLTIGANGTFTGTQSFGSGQAKGSVVATGRFSGTGTTATIKFTLNPGAHSCVNGPVTLTAA
jgi:hypothetical protein